MKYEIITKVYNNGTVTMSEPHPAINEKSNSRSTHICDIYIDVFENKEQAEQFYNENISECY